MLRLATVALLLAVVAACGGSDDEADPPVPTTTAPATTSAATDEDQLRQLAVEWGETVEAVSRGEADADQARDYIEGDYLDGFLQRDASYEGQVAIADARSEYLIESVQVHGDRGSVTECVVNADVLTVEATGEILNDEVNARRHELSAIRRGGGWRFTGIEQLGEWEDSIQCDSE